MERTESDYYEKYDLIGKHKNKNREEICSLNTDEQRKLCLQIIDMQRSLDWNAINSVNFSTFAKKSTSSEVINPQVPPQPKPFRSWLEAYMFYFTKAGQCEHEPSDSHKKYSVECTYKPDWVSPTNPNIVFESKGVIGSNEEARKYKLVRDQNGLEIVFVFLARNIQLPYQKQRKDGSKQTQEQWCRANNFKFCYADNYDEYLASTEYQHLLRAS